MGDDARADLRSDKITLSGGRHLSLLRRSAGTQRDRRRPPIRQWLALQIAARPIGGWDHFAKRCEDVAIALLVLVLASPMMMLATLAIRLESRGPVLFRRRRKGFNGSVFSCGNSAPCMTNTPIPMPPKDMPRRCPRDQGRAFPPTLEHR